MSMSKPLVPTLPPVAAHSSPLLRRRFLRWTPDDLNTRSPQWQDCPLLVKQAVKQGRGDSIRSKIDFLDTLPHPTPPTEPVHGTRCQSQGSSFWASAQAPSVWAPTNVCVCGGGGDQRHLRGSSGAPARLPPAAKETGWGAGARVGQRRSALKAGCGQQDG